MARFYDLRDLLIKNLAIMIEMNAYKAKPVSISFLSNHNDINLQLRPFCKQVRTKLFFIAQAITQGILNKYLLDDKIGTKTANKFVAW